MYNNNIIINISYKRFKTFTGNRKARVRQDLILPPENSVETVTIYPVASANNGNNYVLAVEFDNFEYPDEKTVMQVFPDFVFSDVFDIPNKRLYIPELKYGFQMLVSWKLWDEIVNAGLNERISAVGVSMSRVFEKLTVPVLLDIGKIIASGDYAVMYYKNKQHPQFYHNKETLIKAIQRAYNSDYCSVDKRARVIDMLESQGLLQPIKEAIHEKEQKQLKVVKKKVRSLIQNKGVGKNG